MECSSSARNVCIDSRIFFYTVGGYKCNLPKYSIMLPMLIVMFFTCNRLVRSGYNTARSISHFIIINALKLRLALNQAQHVTSSSNTQHACMHGLAYSTTATVAIICESLEGQLDDSVIISSTDPAVEGTTVMFRCPTGSVSNGLDSSKCMENGEWEPPPYKVNCSG